MNKKYQFKTMKQVNIQYYNSPCGEIILASMGDELCLCDWNEMPCAERNKHRLLRYMKADFKIETSPILDQTKKQLDEYFAGNRKIFDIPLHPVSSEFVSEILPILSLVNTSIGFSPTDSYQINFTLSSIVS